MAPGFARNFPIDQCTGYARSIPPEVGVREREREGRREGERENIITDNTHLFAVFHTQAHRALGLGWWGFQLLGRV